ncbi:MAG: hypothetical protein FWH22_07680, partial [Fibromonadales bacterium]|nr:hypothetical protein [Fibromonadales bacterium]
ATSVATLLFLPSEIHGKKFFYISPTDRLGYTAFEAFGGSALFGLANTEVEGTDVLPAFRLGYANSGFGVALDLSLSRDWSSNKSINSDTRTTYLGDNIGLSFSMPLGSDTFYARARWLSYYSQASETGNTEFSDDYSVKNAVAGLTGTSGSLTYDAYFGAIREGHTYEVDGNKAVDEDTYLGLALGFDLGYAALQSSNARVLVGLNNQIGMLFYDEVKKIKKAGNNIGVLISPNILGEVVFRDNWLAFAGATHSLFFAIINQDGDNNTSYTMLTQDPRRIDGSATDPRTDAFVGVRYEKTNWALEAQVSANPFTALGGQNIFANFGGFIYF